MTGTASAGGDQEYTATFDSDGLDGVLFDLADGPAGASLGPTAAADGTVTFRVHSDTTPNHAVVVRATAPAGFTDANDQNNQAGGQMFTPAPRTADARVVSSQDMNGESGTGRSPRTCRSTRLVSASSSWSPYPSRGHCHRTCGVHAGPRRHHLSARRHDDPAAGVRCGFVRRLGFFREALISFAVSVPGYDDTDALNNTDSERVVARWWEDN